MKPQTRNQPWIFTGRTDAKAEAPIFWPSVWYFGHLIQRADSLEKTLMLGKPEDRRRRGWQRVRWLDGITNSMDMNLSKFREIVKDRGARCAAVEKSPTRLSNWTMITTDGNVSFKPQPPLTHPPLHSCYSLGIRLRRVMSVWIRSRVFYNFFFKFLFF